MPRPADAPLAGRVVSVDARYLKRPGIGISVYLDGAIRTLATAGGEVVLVTDDGAHARSLAARYRLEAASVGARGGFAWEQLALPSYLRGRRPDVHLAGANFGLPLRCPRGTRRALVVHDLIPLRMPGTYLARRPAFAAEYLLSLAASLAAADVVIVNSHATAADVRRLLRRRSLSVLYPRLPAADETAAEPAREPYLLYNGGLDPRKMVPALLAAFAAVHHERPELRLVLLGAGYEALDGELAGFPATRVRGATGRVTTAPAATTACSPTSASTIAARPIQAFAPIAIRRRPTGVTSSSGWWSVS